MSFLERLSNNPLTNVDSLLASARSLANAELVGNLYAVRAGILGRSGDDYAADLRNAASALDSHYGAFRPGDATAAAIILAAAPSRAASVLARLSPTYRDPKRSGVGASTARRLRLVYNAACLLAGQDAAMTVPARGDIMTAIRDGKTTGVKRAIAADAARVRRIKQRGDKTPERHLPVYGLLIQAVARRRGLDVPAPSWRSSH